MGAALLLLALLVPACGGAARETPTVPHATFQPASLRQPAVFVRLVLGSGQWTARQKEHLPAEYEGALVEAMNARAVLARDVRLVPSRDRLDPGVALARAREVGADHAVLVDTDVRRGEVEFCRDARRPFRQVTTIWRQRLVALRASDGAVAFETLNPLEVLGFEPDCDAPRESRTRSAADQLAHAVETLVARLLGR